MRAGQTPVFQVKRVEIPMLPMVWPMLEFDVVSEQKAWDDSATVEGVREDLARGALQLWVLLDQDERVRMTVMTRVTLADRGRLMSLVWAHGKEVLELSHYLDALEQAARDIGCFRLEIRGRRGWERVLREQGYDWKYQVVAKDLASIGKRELN